MEVSLDCDMPELYGKCYLCLRTCVTNVPGLYKLGEGAVAGEPRDFAFNYLMFLWKHAILH